MNDKQTRELDGQRAREGGAPAKTAPLLRRRNLRPWQIAGVSPGIKPELMESRVKMTRPRQAQEVWTGRQNYWRGQRELEQVGEPRALGPMRSHKGELHPPGGSELREDSRNDGHRRERVCLETVPGLEKRVCAC